VEVPVGFRAPEVSVVAVTVTGFAGVADVDVDADATSLDGEIVEEDPVIANCPD